MTKPKPEKWTVVIELIVIGIDATLSEEEAIVEAKRLAEKWTRGGGVSGQVAVLAVRKGRQGDELQTATLRRLS